MSSQETDGGPDGTRDGGASDCAAAGHSLPEGTVAADVETLAALGNDTRYEALRIVAETEGGVCVCELEPSVGVSQGAVSQALSRLFGAGLVERRKDGRWRYYTATPRAERLLAALDDARPASEADAADTTEREDQ